MALRITKTPHEHYQQFQALVRQLKSELIGEDGTTGWYSRLQAQNVSWVEFTRALASLSFALGRMDETAAVPGIAQYVKDQEGDQGYDIAGEYTAMRAAVTAIRDWIFANMPKQAQGGTDYLLVQELNADGTLADRTFTPAQTASLRTLIDTFRATVS